MRIIILRPRHQGVVTQIFLLGSGKGKRLRQSVVTEHVMDTYELCENDIACTFGLVGPQL